MLYKYTVYFIMWYKCLKSEHVIKCANVSWYKVKTDAVDVEAQ